MSNLTDKGNMGAVGDEECIDANHLTTLMDKEEIANDNCTQTLHARVAKAINGLGTHQTCIVWRQRREDGARHGDEGGRQADGPSTIDLTQGNPDELLFQGISIVLECFVEQTYGDASQDDCYRCWVCSLLGRDMEFFRHEHQARVDDGGIKGRQSCHETDLKQDHPFEPPRPILSSHCLSQMRLIEWSPKHTKGSPGSSDGCGMSGSP